MARDFQNDDEPPTGAEAALETRLAAFEDCGTLTAASASTGAINLLGGKMSRVRAVRLPASEGVGPSGSLLTLVSRAGRRRGWRQRIWSRRTVWGCHWFLR